MYITSLKEHIKKLIHNKGLRSFDELFKNSKGAFPEIVYTLVPSEDAAKLLKKKYYGFKETSNIIPESNPANYDWRFDNQTIKKIVHIIEKKKFKRVALFGTPSLFIPVCKIVKDVTLYDINEPLLSHFKNDDRVIMQNPISLTQ